MKYYPGDIVISSIVTFKDNGIEHATKGRPFLVLCVDSCEDSEMQNISCLEITSGAKYLDTIYKERYYKLQNDSLKSESVVRINECYVFNQFQIKKVVNNIGENYFDVINHMFDYYHSKAEIPLSTWQLLCKLDKILENKEIYSDIFTLRHDQLTNYELHRYKGINIHAEKEYQDDQIDHTLERRKRKKLCDKRVSASNNSCYFS